MNIRARNSSFLYAFLLLGVIKNNNSYSTVKAKNGYNTVKVKEDLFMEDKNETVDTTAEVSNETVQEVKKEKTFTQEQLNKYLATEKAKWKQESEAEKNEAERLAKLSAEEKAAEKEKKLAEKENELNYKELVGNAKDVLSDKGIPASFANWIVSERDTAEKVTEKIEDFVKKFNSELEKMVVKRLAGEVPKAGSEKTKKKVSRASY